MINRAVIVGRLTRDPELRKTQSGLSTTSFTVAVDRIGKDKQADFIACVAWRQQADFLTSYAHKGNMVGIEGRIQTRTYEGKGGKVYVTEIVADNVQILESRQKEQQAEQPKQEPAEAGFDTGPSLDVKSDDLPF